MVTILVSLLLLTSLLLAGTTGKISGTVVDVQTGEKLVGANVIIEGTRYGATSNVDGFYAILNLTPGLYKLRVSLVGYQNAAVLDVRVIIDQTTTQDFGLRQTTLQGEEVVIVAQRPIVQKDLSASQANVTIKEISNLPVTSVASVVGLQAGVQGDVIRGGGSDQTAFVMDGFTLRNERDNTPYTAISLSSVQEVQVQTGGFNAEYGNIRSGVINVVTREGSPKAYSASITARLSPPTQKHFGSSVYATDSY
ncbi:MAG: TonB-dependent receptor, partial [Ignavibacteriales bacterium]|nr:TonB-dependent receptor [Ignavibacteriales bacterium]